MRALGSVSLTRRPRSPIAVRAASGRWMVLSDVPSVRDSLPPYPHARASACPMVVALSLIAIVVAGMFATMVVTVRSLDATSQGAARHERR